MKIVSLALAAVSFIFAALYFTGHGPAAAPHETHVKHGVLFIVVGLLALVWYRFQSAAVVEKS